MTIKRIAQKGFSLLEVLLASIIFVISVAGVFATLNSVRAPVTNKETQLAAAVYGKQVLEALYSQVNAGTYYNGSCNTINGDGSCGDFSLYLSNVTGQHEVSLANCGTSGYPPCMPASISGSNSNLSYIVSCADGSTDCNSASNPNVARRVDLGINWPSI